MVRSLLRRWWLKLLSVITLLGLIVLIGGWFGYRALTGYSDSNEHIYRWLTQPQIRAQLKTTRQQCDDAPFILPSEGFIGLLWNDPDAPYNLLRPHTGIDIFGDGQEGTIPVYAVYDGYLTRLPDWFSTVIIAHDDPLHPGEKVWSYYTHLASGDASTSFIVDDFPAGTSGKWVEQGTLLGYQGKYNGGKFPIALHVHLSIVKSDGNGNFTNEADLSNTLDPSPYFGLMLNQRGFPTRPIRCAYNTSSNS
jgi:peptidoglycan LD-endopeptidase LytH